MLGHAKAAITLDRYTGVLDSMSARTDERLDAVLRATSTRGGNHRPRSQVRDLTEAAR
jgi:hypothetical protein